MNVSIVVGGKTLKVKFTQDRTKVTVQVLEQDESLRGKGTIMRGKNGYAISSSSLPEIGIRWLYVRGCIKDKDNRQDMSFFETEEKATAYIKNISELIQEINGKAKGESEEMNESIIIRTDGFKL